MTGKNLDIYLGRAFVGDGVATMLSGAVGGTGVTTYAENIGVMTVTRIYSTLVFVVAACIAILLGFSPKFGALIQIIPGAVLGGRDWGRAKDEPLETGVVGEGGARLWFSDKL